MLAILAIIAGVQLQAKTVTFDFINNGLKMFDGITAVSSTTSTDGDFTEEKSYTLDGVTITVSPSGGRNANRFWSWDNGSQLRIYGGTIKFSSTEKMTGMKFTQPSKSPKWSAPSASVGTVSTDEWTYSEGTTEVTFTFSAQCRMNSVTVTLGDGGDTPNPPTPTTPTDVANIAAFNALTEGATANLTLTNAQVQYTFTSTNGNTSTFIKDATGALMLYNSGLILAANQVVNGTVVLLRAAYNQMIQATAVTGQTNANSLTITDGAAVVPSEITIPQASNYVSYLVQLKNVKIISVAGSKYTDYYAVSGTDTIQVYNGFHLTEANLKDMASANVTGIIERYNNKYEICPTIALENNDGTPNPPTPSGAKSLPYEKDFVADGIDDFTVNTVVNTDAVSEIWKHNSTYGATANGYINRENHVIVSYLVSPVINLTTAKKPQLTYEHLGRYFGDPSKEATIHVIDAATKDTTALTINHYFDNATNDVSVNDTIDLSKYVGKNVQIAFRYESNAVNAGRWQIKNMKVAEATGTVTPVDTVKAANIAEFLALAENTNAQLTLTDAQVLYTWTSNNNNNSTFVRDASGALLLYNAGLDLTANQVVNGKVMLQRAAYNKMPQAKAISGSTSKNGLTITDGTAAAPAKITPAQGASNVANLVEVTDVTIRETAGKFYAVSGKDSIQLYNGFHLEGITLATTAEGYVATVTGIVEQYNSTYELYPIDIKLISTGINDINADKTIKNDAIYNIAGQRVGRNYRGVVIINGKKYINK